jgi:hypothetical protein
MTSSLQTGGSRATIRKVADFSVSFGNRCDRYGAPIQDQAVAWRNSTALNGHMLVAGGSGAGKTHQLRRLIGAFAKGNARVHVIDVHGDIDVDDAHTVRFSESTTFGLNPLEISSDPDFGGPRKRALAFVSTLRRLTNLGDRQRTALNRLIMDLYRSYGFEPNDPSTWGLDKDPRSWAKSAKRFPTMGDLKTYTMRKLKAMKFGVNTGAVVEFDKLAREILKFNRLRTAAAKGQAEPIEIATQRAKCVETYSKGLERMESGTELEDLLAWDSVEAVKGLYDRIEALEASGVFRGSRPDFPENKAVRRYDISALNRDEQQMFVDTMLADLFFRAKQNGQSAGLDEVVVIDEAANFIDEDTDHIINVVYREARKFGLGVVLASQSLTHMTESQISSACVKLILGVDELYHSKMEGKLGLAKGKLRFIRPKQTALVQIKSSGDMTNRFEEIAVEA